MPERLNLGSISAVTDCDAGMYQIGEIDGGFHTDLLKHQIEKYGTQGILAQLAYMTHSVIEMQREINAVKSSQDLAEAGRSRR